MFIWLKYPPTYSSVYHSLSDHILPALKSELWGFQTVPGRPPYFTTKQERIHSELWPLWDFSAFLKQLYSTLSPPLPLLDRLLMQQEILVPSNTEHLLSFHWFQVELRAYVVKRR